MRSNYQSGPYKLDIDCLKEVELSVSGIGGDGCRVEQSPGSPSVVVTPPPGVGGAPLAF